MSVIEIGESQGFPAVINVRRGPELRSYVPKRMCRMVDNGCELCCSECDCRHEYDDEPSYCQSCGARVVSDDDRR